MIINKNNRKIITYQKKIYLMIPLKNNLSNKQLNKYKLKTKINQLMKILKNSIKLKHLITQNNMKIFKNLSQFLINKIQHKNKLKMMK